MTKAFVKIASLTCVLSLTAILVVLVGVRIFRSGTGHPSISLSSTQVDFGRLKPGERVETILTIENDGSKSLELDDPTASCGCQTPLLARKVLGPGDRTTLTLRQVAAHEIGPFRHVVFLKSNDPLKPSVKIYLDGTVTKGVLIRPEPLVFDRMALGEVRTRSIDILSDEEKAFSIKFVNAFGPVRARGVVDVASELHKIQVTAAAGDDLGDFEGQVVVNLDVPGIPPLMIPVFLRVRGPFSISPSSLNLGLIAGQSVVERKVVVSGSDKIKFRIGKTLGLPAEWSAECKIPTGGARVGPQVLELRMKTPNLPGPIRASLMIEITSDQGVSRMIELPITASITENK